MTSATLSVSVLRWACGHPRRLPRGQWHDRRSHGLHRALRCTEATLLLCIASGPLTAQRVDQGCTGASCALHVRGSGLILKPHVVQGEGSLETDLGLLDRSPVFRHLFATDDSAALRYEHFVVHDRRADRMRSLGIIVAAIGILPHAVGRNWSFGNWLLYAGGATYIGAYIPERQARRDFLRAVTSFNARFVGLPPPADSPRRRR